MEGWDNAGIHTPKRKQRLTVCQVSQVTGSQAKCHIWQSVRRVGNPPLPDRGAYVRYG
ncbi:MAG: hypothetical protein Fur0021_35430 [Candidatus Promineifilaceae bacterium]